MIPSFPSIRGLAFLLLGACLTSPLAAQADSNTPNILLIVADDMSFYTLGSSGNEYARTPNLDQLAQQGALFDHAYATALFCKPARNSLFTSLLPHQHGWYTNQVFEPAPTPSVYFPELLRQAGYETAGYGKWHSSFLPADAGITTWEDSGDVMGRGLNFLASHSGSTQPWFMYLSFWETHSPWQPPQPFLDQFTAQEFPLRPNVNQGRTGKPLIQDYFEDESRRKLRKLGTSPAEVEKIVMQYMADASYLDSQIGQIFNSLRIHGMEDNTIVLLTSDQGVMVGNHGLYFKGIALYEEYIRIPFMIRWPRRLSSGMSFDLPVSTIDIAPTLLEAAGLPVPAEFQGSSLMPLLQNRPFQGDSFEIHQTAREGPYSGYVRGLRTHPRSPQGDFKLILNQNDWYELYDLQNDPYELNNVAYIPAYLGTYQKLRNQLLAWMQTNNDPAYDIFR